MTSHSPEDFARVLLSRLKIEPPTDLEAVATAIGLRIQTVESVGFDGVMRRIPNQARGIVAVRAGIRGLGRARFTMAHEIGHYVMEHGKGTALCRSSDIDKHIDLNNDEEVGANRFAAELLMPAEHVSRMMGKQSISIKSVKRVAERLKSSLTATAIQCIKVTNEPCAVVISVDAKIRFYKPSDSWKHVVRVGFLDKRSAAVGLDLEHNERTACVPLSAWATDRTHPVSKLEEQSIYLPPHNMTLSLLKPIVA